MGGHEWRVQADRPGRGSEAVGRAQVQAQHELRQTLQGAKVSVIISNIINALLNLHIDVHDAIHASDNQTRSCEILTLKDKRYYVYYHIVNKALIR